MQASSLSVWNRVLLFSRENLLSSWSDKNAYKSGSILRSTMTRSTPPRQRVVSTDEIQHLAHGKGKG